MNTNVKILIGATIGAGIGYFVGSVIAEIVAIKDWEKANPGESFDDHIDDMVDGNENDPIEDEENAGMKLIERSRSGGVMSKTIKKNYSDIFKNRPDIAKLAAKYNGDQQLPLPEEPTTVQDEIGGIAHDIVIEDEFDHIEMVEKPISIISMSEFANDDEGFETLTLNYYDDDVVTDEHDNPIDHHEQLLGEDALVSFGVMSQDEDVVYVKNLPKKAMYEVVRTNKNYAVQKSRAGRKAAVKRQLLKEEHGGEADT